MMAQLLAHLWGDYILQSHWMAVNKQKNGFVCCLHAILYTACFIPILIIHRHTVWAMEFILLSHYFIDTFGLARYVVWAKNLMGPNTLSWRECSATGYPPETPVWLSTWLLIVADNTLHLTCNYIALRWL